MVATNPAPSASVYRNYTLALVAGAPQSAFSAASSESVVASVVSWVMVVGSELIPVAPETVSCDTMWPQRAIVPRCWPRGT